VEKLRRIVPVLGILILAVAIYDGSIFYRRWAGNRQARQAQADRETDQAQKAIAMVGGGDLKIVSFYAAPGTIARGGQTSVCYGVTGAKTVRLEPPIQAVWPALTRCFAASLRKDTELKLTAGDGAGRTVSQSFVVRVR
jgi:hypothetical protein